MQRLAPFVLLLVTAAPALAGPAEQELQTLGAQLTGAQALTGAARREVLTQHIGKVSRRLDLFFVRFDRNPNNVRGWKTLERAARRILARWRTIERGSSSQLVARATLLELAGRTQAAHRALGRAVDWADGGCQLDDVAYGSALLRRSGLRQRTGDATGALDDVTEAIQYVRKAPADLDLILCRRAYLLMASRQGASARAQYQRIVDAFPTSRGAKIARARLGKALRTTKLLDRLLTTAVEGELLVEQRAARTRFRSLVPTPKIEERRGWIAPRRRRAVLRKALRAHRKRARKTKR